VSGVAAGPIKGDHVRHHSEGKKEKNRPPQQKPKRNGGSTDESQGEKLEEGMVKEGSLEVGKNPSALMTNPQLKSDLNCTIDFFYGCGKKEGLDVGESKRRLVM